MHTFAERLRENDRVLFVGDVRPLTVKRQEGPKRNQELSYDPRRLQGVRVYRDGEPKFAKGDRAQLTASDFEQVSWRFPCFSGQRIA